MVEYEIFPRLRLVRFSWSGIVSARQMVEVSIAYTRDPGFRPDFNMTMDLRGGRFAADIQESLSEVVQGCLPYYESHEHSVRSALYAPDETAFEVARRYSAQARAMAHYPIEVFRTAGGALRFLGVAPDDPEAERVYPSR